MDIGDKLESILKHVNDVEYRMVRSETITAAFCRQKSAVNIFTMIAQEGSDRIMMRRNVVCGCRDVSWDRLMLMIRESALKNAGIRFELTEDGDLCMVSEINCSDARTESTDGFKQEGNPEVQAFAALAREWEQEFPTEDS